MMMRISETVKQLIIINVIFFIGTLIVGEPAYRMLALFFPENPNFHFWQPLSHMFMHGGIGHIFFNMFALYSFGVVLEQMWGAKKFIFFYLSCGLGAVALHIAVNYFVFYNAMDSIMGSGISKTEILTLLNTNPDGLLHYADMSTVQSLYNAYATPAVGASGAIYGVLVAFAFMFPNAELMLLFLPVPIKAKYFVPGILAIDLFMGIKGNSIFGGGDGVAHFAHLGGALIGFLMMWYWKKQQFNNNRWN